MTMLTSSSMVMAQIEGNENELDDDEVTTSQIERKEGQYLLGDYIEIGGVPSCVVYVDETGKHGIAMSFPFFKKKKFLNKAISDFKGSLSPDLINLYTNNIVKTTSYNKKQIYVDLNDKLGDDGEENTKILEQYCIEKGLPLQKTFPMIYCVKQLGDGWYVPGREEIEYFAKFYAGGLGRHFGMNGVKFDKLYKKRCMDERAGIIVKNSFYQYSSSLDKKNGLLMLWRFTVPGFTARTTMEYSAKGVKQTFMNVNGYHKF